MSAKNAGELQHEQPLALRCFPPLSPDSAVLSGADGVQRGCKSSAVCSLFCCVRSLSQPHTATTPIRAGVCFLNERSVPQKRTLPPLPEHETPGGLLCLQPRGPRRADGCAMPRTRPGFLRKRLRAPWDSSRLRFSGLSSSGAMLSGVEAAADTPPSLPLSPLRLPLPSPLPRAAVGARRGCVRRPPLGSGTAHREANRTEALRPAVSDRGQRRPPRSQPRLARPRGSALRTAVTSRDLPPLLLAD